MAKETEKFRKKAIDLSTVVDPVGGKMTKKLDKEAQKRGAFVESEIAQGQRDAKTAKAAQQELIGKQRQAEQLRLAEADNAVGRRRLLKRTGGRQSLIASK